MADLPISGLDPISAADIQPSTDQLAVAHIAGSETKKATPTAVVTSALTKTPGSGGLPNNVIPAKQN